MEIQGIDNSISIKPDSLTRGFSRRVEPPRVFHC